jgi:hypothetical protein
MSDLDLTHEPESENAPKASSGVQTKPVDLDEIREGARGDLARGLLYLLTFAIGGVLVFIGTGRLDGTVLTQSVFPSLIALAGTALGFYFGSQSNNGGVSATGKVTSPGSNVPSSRPGPTGANR